MKSTQIQGSTECQVVRVLRNRKQETENISGKAFMSFLKCNNARVCQRNATGEKSWGKMQKQAWQTVRLLPKVLWGHGHSKVSLTVASQKQTSKRRLQDGGRAHLHYGTRECPIGKGTNELKMLTSQAETRKMPNDNSS